MAEALMVDLAATVHGDLLDQGGGTAEIFTAISRHAPLLGARERESLHRQVTLVWRASVPSSRCWLIARSARS